MDAFITQEVSEDLQCRKVVVIGTVGSGKTCMCNYVAGKYTMAPNQSKVSGHSITKQVVQYKGMYIRVESVASKVQFSMLDSEGYGSDEYKQDELRNQLLEALRFETELNALIITASFERFRNGLKDDLAHIIGLVNTIGISMDNIILCLTHCEMYTDVAKKAYLDEFKKYYGLNIPDGRVLFCCFANITEINDDFKPLVAEAVKKSIFELRAKIAEITTSINSASKIALIEKAK